MHKPVIAVTVGDPAGIGPEIAEKAVSNQTILRICKPIIIGSSYGFTAGKNTRKSDKAAILFLNKAVELLRKNVADAVVTAPVSKSAFGKIGGHTEFFANKFNLQKVEMLMMADELKVLLLTRHIPLKDVSKEIKIDKIVGSVEFASSYLRKRFNKKKLEIFICGLNPHCGDKGLVGKEEQKIIIPAIIKMRKNGLNVFGPMNPEDVFNKHRDGLIVSIYHDQAMIPLKILKPNKIVNLTIGLPFVRTSPGHGTGYDIAGKGKANPESMIEALKLACYLTKKEKLI